MWQPKHHGDIGQIVELHNRLCDHQKTVPFELENKFSGSQVKPVHTPGPRGKGLKVSQLCAYVTYLDLNAIARVDMDAICAVQESQGATGAAAEIRGLHMPFTLGDVVITQN